jgi:hypothetical protein
MSILDAGVQTAPSEQTALAQEIQEKSEEVRSSLAGRVLELKDQVDQLFDWSHYVCEHPWAIASLAGALGYALAPALRRRTAENDESSLHGSSSPPRLAAIDDKSSGPFQFGGMLSEIALQTAVAFTARQAAKYVAGILNGDPLDEAEVKP